MKRAGVIIGIVLIAIAYVLGFWPQYQKAQTSREQLKQVTAELADVQGQVRLYRLQHELLAVVRQADQRNYGQASALSTTFFNAVRDELPRRTEPKVKSALESILRQRDAVTSALAKGDPGAIGLLQPLENTLFQVLGGLTGGTAAGAA